jgi:hypothetical protein
MYVLFLSNTICSPMIFKVNSRFVKEAYTRLKTKALRMAGEKENLDEMFANVTIGDDSAIGCYPIVVYIDEAHEIGPLDGFDSAFADLQQEEIVGIYLSTTSGINHLAPPPNMIDSGRNAPGVTHLLPFTELYLDTFSHRHFTGASTDLTLEKVRSISVAASIGRALYVFIIDGRN